MEDSCGICIFGISSKTCEYDIKEFVKAHGTPKWISVCRERDYALVMFHDRDTAANAVRDLNCRQLRQKNVNVKIDMRQLRRAVPTIFLTDVAHTTRESDVIEFLEGFNGISRINLTNVGKGFIHVDFVEQETADRAVWELQYKKLCGNRVKVNYATIRPGYIGINAKRSNKSPSVDGNKKNGRRSSGGEKKKPIYEDSESEYDTVDEVWGSDEEAEGVKEQL